MKPRRLDRLTIRSTRSGWPSDAGASGAASSPVCSVMGRGYRPHPGAPLSWDAPGTSVRSRTVTSLASSRPRTVSTARSPARSTSPSRSGSSGTTDAGTPTDVRSARARPSNVALLVAEHLVGRGGAPPGPHGLDVALRGVDVPPPAPAPMRMGRAPDAPVVALGPVQGVVATLVAGHGPVRHLVPPVPRRRQRRVDQPRSARP